MPDHDHLLRSVAWWAMWVTFAALAGGIGLVIPYRDSGVAGLVSHDRHPIAITLFVVSGVLLLVAVFALVDGLQGLRAGESEETT